MKEDIVSFETAKLAKEHGFDWESSCAYDKDGVKEYPLDHIGSTHFSQEDIKNAERNEHPTWLAPTQSLLQKWLRKEHYISIEVKNNRTSGLGHTFEIIYGYYPNYKRIISNGVDRNEGGLRIPPFPKYEQALEAALQEALKLIT